MSESRTKPDIRTAKILFAEDQDLVKKVLFKTFLGLLQQTPTEQQAWEAEHVTWVKYGEAAIQAFDTSGEKPCNLVLLDNNLKDAISGVDVAIHLRENGYTGPILLLTSDKPEKFFARLNLQHAKKNDETGNMEITLIESKLPENTTRPRHTAYFSSKPCDRERLSCILKQAFTLPDDIPAIDADPRTIPNPVWDRLNNAIAASKNTETNILDENVCLSQLRIFQDFLRTHFNDLLTTPLHIQIDHGHIPEEGATRHILSSTLNILLTIIPETLDTADAELDNTWVNQTYSIIKDMLRHVGMAKQAEFPQLPDNQESGF